MPRFIVTTSAGGTSRICRVTSESAAQAAIDALKEAGTANVAISVKPAAITVTPDRWQQHMRQQAQICKALT